MNGCAVISDYNYDVLNRTSISYPNGSSQVCEYDTLYRLVSEVITASANGDFNASYSYDEVGNWVEEIINGVTTGYTYEENDSLTQTGGISYSHDAQGNTTTYRYNSQQELVSVLTGSGQSLSSQYNTDGIRTGCKRSTNPI